MLGFGMGSELTTTDEVKKRFSRALNAALIDKFGGRMSAASVAREFSLLPECPRPISGETARKWLKGIGFPDLDNLVLLCNWLDLDLSMIFKKNGAFAVRPAMGSMNFGRRAVDRNFSEALEVLGSLPDGRAEKLIKVLRQLAEI